MDRPVSGELTVGGFDLGPDARVFVSVSRTNLPGEVFAVDEHGDLSQLTRVNQAFLRSIRLGQTLDATFPSADGTEIESLFYLPPGYQEGMRYPTLLRIHGGPVSQYSHSFNFEAHLLAAKGYVVVTPNPRGSSGYGQEFSHAIWADWGNKDYQDVLAAVDHAVQEGWADPERLGVGGWSYGGILTDHVITKTDRFKAAITGASEFLYVSNYGHDHYQLQWEKELGLPWENRETWERISPFNRVDKITTPTLVMGGEKDWNVPIHNGEQLYQALRRMGRETQLVVYPGQSHGLSVPAYQVDRYERYLEWYDRYVKQLTEPVVEEGR
jgi:dipeptidyl aminopeptidase/acylaminoacyl peptidase